MATSSKFDLSSGSPDRPLYTSGQRGTYMSGTMERSSSFRDSTDNPVLSSLPNMSRSSSVANQGDVINFFQCLRFDPKLVAAEHKYHQQGDFKRSISIALGVPLDESPSGPSKGKQLASPSLEQLKRVKAGLRESCIKSRERIKTFNEALSVHNKFFPVKKRSRSDAFPYDRPVPGTIVGKMGSQSHAGTCAFDLDQQKSEERIKIGVPNKRTRTSLVDVRMDTRNNAVARPSGAVDRDRDVLRHANSGAVQSEDRTPPIGIDGWGEKPKMKKKRSGIKPDVSAGMVSPKPIDVYRETKQGVQQRLLIDSRPRLNNDSYGHKPVASTGAVGVGKADGVSQLTSSSVRSSIPRPEQDSCSLTSDRRDRSFGLGKERLNLRAVNKANVRDDFNSGSPTSNAKMNASIRGPRSGSGVSPKLSPNVHRSTASNDWEVSHCTNKPPAAVGPNNRKRMASTRSSSPPVAHWAGQRPQKSSRTARRTNLVPIVTSNDEQPASDSVSDATGNEVGLGYARRLSGNSPPNVKVKGEPLSSAMLSESEESGAAEIKSKDRGRKSDEFDEKARLGVQKVSTGVVSSRKSKMVSGEENGDGVRRQGRTGRGVGSTRTVVPMTMEKLGNVGTAKQLRTVKLGFERSESKAGRPLTRKLSDRKAYTRQRHTAVNATADFLVGSDDGHEELLAAANAVMNSGHALSSPYWKKTESFFGLISDVDITYLKQQVNHGSSILAPTPGSSDADVNNALNGNQKEMGLGTDTSYVGILGEGTEDPNMNTLCQRLIAALIPEAENIEVWSGENEDLKFDANESGFDLDEEFEPESSHYPSLGDFLQAGHTAINGYRMSRKSEYEDQESNKLGILNTGVNSTFSRSRDDGYCDQGLMPSMACTESQYDSMNINEKLLLEFQSVGIFPEALPDMAQSGVGRINEDISRLEEKYHMQVFKKKSFLDKLLKSAVERKEFQEREFQHNALDKLVGMAYEKYMSCWGPSKSSSNKMAKQAALALVKRTLERCHKFEETGRSCFSEPLFRDMFVSGSSMCNGAQSLDTMVEGESAKQHAGTVTRSSEARVPASLSSQQSPSMTSRLGQNMDTHDVSSYDLVLPVNEHTVKQDTWSNRGKRRELLLDDVVGVTIGGSSSGPLSIGSPLSSSTKGKRSERDREGKGLSRNGTNKVGRPTLSNVKGERKSKTKPKQKTTQLSVSVNGLIGKISEQPKPAVPPVSKSSEITKEKGQFGLDELDDPIDLSHLQLPGMDVLGGDDLDGQGEDLGSWLNIDDDGLQDNDFMGLEIPMDDLSDLNMMV